MTKTPDRYLLALADAARVARSANLSIRGEQRYGQQALAEQIAVEIEKLEPPEQDRAVAMTDGKLRPKWLDDDTYLH